MKKNHYLLPLSVLASLAFVAALVFGCQKNQNQTSPAPSSSGAVSVEKTSFSEVTSQLDPGGNFYLYLGTAQWLDNLSGKMAAWQEKIVSMPGAQSGDLDDLNKAFTVLTNLVKDSGLEDLSGVGMSSVEVEKGMYHNKMLLHHYPGKGDGFLWQLCGKEPHPLTGLDYLPANTAMAFFSDADLPLLWSVIQREVNNSDIPQAQQWVQEVPAQFEQKAGVKWDQFLSSLGGEFGLVLTLDASNNITLPLPTDTILQIPAPGLMLVVKVNDDTIFNRIDEELKNNPMATSVDKPDFKMRTMPVPLPLPIQLRPSAASSGGYLFIASSDALIEEALAVKSGQKPGLKSTDEFKQLSQNIPDQGNQFAYISRQFGETMADVQKQALASGPASMSAQSQWMQSLFQNRAGFAYSVGMNTSDGSVTVGNGSQSYASLALLPVVAVPGMLAAIAIPNFVKARTTSQENACINNLRMIDAAKHEWALEKGKAVTDVPTWEDLKPYLPGQVPLVCPAGGTYSLNAVGEHPTFSIPGHRLP
jgi:hypothetical protein